MILIDSVYIIKNEIDTGILFISFVGNANKNDGKSL